MGCVMDKTLGQFIRERRQELGLTQEALAERIGGSVRQAEVSRLENDAVSLPRRERMEGIAAALEVSLGDLMVLTGWLNEGHVHVVGGQDDGKSDAGNGSPDQPLAQAVESVHEAKAMVADTAKKLDEAEEALLIATNAERGRSTPTDGASSIAAM
jgi:transcriptional regulator with XRE-family HTH domain